MGTKESRSINVPIIAGYIKWKGLNRYWTLNGITSLGLVENGYSYRLRKSVPTAEAVALRVRTLYVFTVRRAESESSAHCPNPNAQAPRTQSPLLKQDTSLHSFLPSVSKNS